MYLNYGNFESSDIVYYYCNNILRESETNNLPILLALFPFCFVKNTQYNYGYVCVFCLAERKNNFAEFG